MAETRGRICGAVGYSVAGDRYLCRYHVDAEQPDRGHPEYGHSWAGFCSPTRPEYCTYSVTICAARQPVADRVLYCEWPAGHEGPHSWAPLLKGTI